MNSRVRALVPWAVLWVTLFATAIAVSSTQANAADLQLPAGMELRFEGAAPEAAVAVGGGCESCVVVTLRNRTAESVRAFATIRPVAEVNAPDRSFGSWIYSYRHEQVLVENSVLVVEADTSLSVSGLASRSRFDLRAIVLDGAKVAYESGSYQLPIELLPGDERTLTFYSGLTLAAEVQDSSVEAFLYWSLWSPFRTLCFGLERLAQWLLPLFGPFLFVLAIVVLVRGVTYPINRWSFRKQQEFEALNLELAPQIADIKTRLTGGDRSEAILELYQSRGMNPLAGLKGSVGLFVQIPILIAMFNVASDSALFSGVAMGWISDIAQPEHTLGWGLDVPFLGSFFNLVAAGLAAFMIWGELKKPQRSTGTLLFAIAVGVLLYSFPAVLVVYWFLITIAQRIEQR